MNLLYQVDVVYIGNLHTDHKQTVLMMFDAGKAVLCEKPLTCSAQDTADLITAAKEKNIFFMEVGLMVDRWQILY